MTTLPVHAAAEGIYRGQSLDWSNPGFWTAEVCQIIGHVDFDRLQQSIVDTVADADALHTRFIERSGVLGQVIQVDPSWRPEVVELSTTGGWEHVRQAVADRVGVAADVSTGPLFDITLFRCEDTVWWFTRAHHLVLDGYGYGLLYRQVSRRYRGSLRDTDRFGRLADLVAADVRARRDATKDRLHWTRRLADVTVRGFSDGVALPSPKPLFCERPLPRTEPSRAGSAWPHRLMAATAAALHRHTGESTVVLGVPVADRLGTAAANVPAMVMNIAALPVRVESEDRLELVQDRITEALRRDRPHHRYRYEQLRRDMAVGNGRLFGAVVNAIPFAAPPRLPGADVTVHQISAGPVDDLAVTARDATRFTVEANPASYTAQQVHDIADEISTILSGGGSVGRWEVLPEEPAVTPVDWLRSLHEHADTAPGSVALIDGERRWTYSELEEAVRRAAAVLIGRGAEPGDLVALCLPRSAEAVIAILAAGYAGCGYLPLDPDGATERNRRIIAEARPKLVVDTGLSAPDTPIAEQPATARPIDTAYVIYTSGSTGTPKGVRIPNAALAHFLGAAHDRYRFEPTDRILQFAPLHFDAHVEEVFSTIAAGATLVLRDDSATESLEAFTAFVNRQRLTVLDLPTAYWHELVLALHNGLTRLPASVHTVIIGGEAADSARVAQWHALVGDEVRLLNTYGPTEATVVCLVSHLRRGGPVDLGRPIPGVAAAIGTAGELHVSGPTLATGYVGETGDDRFVYRDGTRWYRTGDVVSRRDGTLRFEGRIDDEVKISGHRIHPREVESALAQCHGVDEAAVSIDSGGTRLVAYVAGEADPSQLRDEVSRRLPAVAVPAVIVVLDRLPRTPSGKIDHRGLSEVRPLTVSRGEKPRNEFEQAVHSVFTEVLRAAPDTLHTDFFTAGGTSLSAVAAAGRLSAELNITVTAAQVFEHPTVAKLAAALTGNTSSDSRFGRDHHWRATTGLGTATDDRIVLTGASGFVGAHVLAALLRRSTGTVTCVGRGGMARLCHVAADLGLPRPDGERVEVIPGDLAEPGLGLSEADRAKLAGAGDIIHCAAQVSLNRGYDSLRTVNVTATGDLLRLAYEGGSRFHQVSTVAVSGGRQLPEEFVEVNDGLRDGYQRSKWVAEELVRQAGEAGLAVACYRLGRVTAATDTARPNPTDLLGQLVTASDLIETLPDLPVEEPHIAADVAADAITGLVIDRSSGVWNLTLGAPVRLTTALRRLRPDLPVVDLGTWRARLASCKNQQAATVAAFFALRDGEPSGATPRIDNDRFTSWWAAR